MISSYLVDDVTIIKYDTEDVYNEPTPTAEIEVKGYIEYKTKLLSDLKGQEVVGGTVGRVLASAMIRFDESIDVSLGRALSHEDKIKFNSIEYAILEINKPKAFSNPHYEVWVA